MALLTFNSSRFLEMHVKTHSLNITVVKTDGTGYSKAKVDIPSDALIAVGGETSYYICLSTEDGLEEFRTLSEIEFATNEGKRADLIPDNKVKVNASIVGSLDLTFGNKLKPVIQKGIEISEGRLKGIRMLLAAHPDPRIKSGAVNSDLSLMSHPKFVEGARCLQDAGLSLDFWIYHTQLSEMEKIAMTLPELSIILNHIGGPIHLGEYEGKQALTHREWRTAMMRLSRLPNIKVKLGGLGMEVNGAKFHLNHNPPNSSQLADTVSYTHLTLPTKA